MDATCAIQASIHVFSLVRKYVSRILGTYQTALKELTVWVFYVDYSFLDFSVMPWRSAYPVRIRVRAPSPVTLHAVPKLSCRAKMVSIRAVPVSLNNRIPVISPREAITVPPGTPGAPMAKMPSSTQNRIMVPSDGIEPYRI